MESFEDWQQGRFLSRFRSDLTRSLLCLRTSLLRPQPSEEPASVLLVQHSATFRSYPPARVIRFENIFSEFCSPRSQSSYFISKKTWKKYQFFKFKTVWTQNSQFYYEKSNLDFLKTLPLLL